MTNSLLPGEGAVGSYGELLKRGRRGDNLTPHHIPSNAFMTARVLSYTRDKGIAIMMEHLSPGMGGRHRQTLSYGKSPDLSLSPREVLAREVWDVRSIYRRQGLYTPAIRQSLQQVIQLNKSVWQGNFDKRRV
ncbi:hypothetical protein [Floridanema aerugineum]|uniref:Uncharacterized protein n=1 Tax=Floridaenema aerugineum BLCC-F46 TaxID=3153654 RepID=A0ABV4X4S3_9CYAN